MSHDPERDAAAFLGGTMSRRRRRAFERHMVECEECWREVDLGRRGRAVAEAGRELAPQPLRERVRAVVETVPPRSPSRRLGWRIGAGGAVAVVTAIVVAFALAPEEQPAPIDAAVRAFARAASVGSPAPPDMPRRLGDLRLTDSRAGHLEGLEVVVHSYEDPAGHRVTIYQSDRSFPVARGAEHDRAADTWAATLDGVEVFCVDDPVPSLLVGDDRREVLLAARELELL